MTESRELIIIGAGPAGITAAVYAARKKMDFMVLTDDIGGQAAWSGSIENYTGYQLISGPDLVAKFEEHLGKYRFDLQEGVRAEKVLKDNDDLLVKATDGKEYRARTVIIASGKNPKALGVPGESEFKNRGVTYCATCDGPLFAGKEVAVIGGGNSALDAALQLIKIASRVHVINLADELTGDPVMKEKLSVSANCEIINSAKVVGISGGKFVEMIAIETGGKRRKIPAQGVFIEIGVTPNSSMIDIVKKNEQGEILIDCASRTSVAGIFAAGDVTNVPEKQIIVAAGEGAKAALSAFRYLASHK
ncbi:MAG TPA: FAD-dependent oxidoreductase [Candidatus Omnitrophota bacterium]|nr:FAD-dependent oxidoreductase [Candidatus Omnitrophota bacterium]